MQAARQQDEDPLVSVSDGVPRRLNEIEQRTLARLAPLFPNGVVLLRQGWTYGEAFRVPKLSAEGVFALLGRFSEKTIDATALHRIMADHHEMREDLEELFALVVHENNLSVN